MGIAEDLVLLAVNPRSGRFTVTDMLIYALRSAQLADLVVAGLVTVDDGQIEIIEKVKRPLPFEESVAVDAIKRLREQTVDQWMSKTSRTLEMNYVRSLDRQGAVELDPKWYKYQFLSGQRATAVDQVRYYQVLARVDRVARGEIPSAQADEPSAEIDRTLAALVYASGLDKRLYRGRRGRAKRDALAGVVDQRKLAEAARTAAGQPAQKGQPAGQSIDEMLHQLDRRVINVLRYEFNEWYSTISAGTEGHGEGGHDSGHGGGHDGGFDSGGGHY
jgi:hypothetical protein